MLVPVAFTVPGLLNGDTVTNVLLASVGSVSNASVGNYPIVASAAMGSGLTNYTIGYSNGTLDVTQAVLVARAEATSPSSLFARAAIVVSETRADVADPGGRYLAHAAGADQLIEQHVGDRPDEFEAGPVAIYRVR